MKTGQINCPTKKKSSFPAAIWLKENCDYAIRMDES